ncbi:hypothetical protein THAOC_13984 [Thalassiosira oceanica]|uniref:Uncharacterized protein n=1 Tax=Thalassiosira oceanica TaxID=159749 RepID=K0SJT5_THAOC|nr:hypothetical protein THAOC_13984 [Thalassiosira oceanica]|eukprot:EJK65189.1 hypothetical protein THAOC_13984 [Thalassiosira oceanica]
MVSPSPSPRGFTRKIKLLHPVRHHEAYTLTPMYLPAFYIPRGSGKTTWEPTSTSTPTATPCFHAEISGFEPPDTPQIQQVYGAMNPLLAYTLALMHLPAFHIPRGSGKTTWEPTSTSTPTATPCFHAEISGSEPSHTPYGALLTRLLVE